MDATRPRRTRDAARQRWYAACRCRRLARLLGFPSLPAAADAQASQRLNPWLHFTFTFCTVHTTLLLPNPTFGCAVQHPLASWSDEVTVCEDSASRM